jgi:protein-S-isoprenylcysteine O-methyltransferase Ste14
MAAKGINAFIVFGATLVVVSAVTLIFWPFGLLLGIMNVGALAAEWLILRFSRPEMLKRRIPMEHWWDKLMVPLIALLIIATAVLSVLDVLVFKLSVLPSWTFLLGIALLMAGYLIFTQAMRAHSPHAAEKYGEAPEPPKKDRGPYEVVRHPVMLAVLLAGISVPLFIGSGIGFAPVGLLIVAIVARVAAEDDWRFNNYEWFYDYTKEVSYRLIPFIW